MTASREVQPDSFMDSPPTSPTPETEYLPESDGKPMAETDVHRTQMIELLECLAEYYRADPRVYVTGNIFLYFRNHEGERQSISPDIFVVRGVEKKLRRIYNLDVEKKVPDVVLELTSRHTKVEDLGNKRVIYADLGVSEYFLFDPLDGTLTPQLRGFRLQGSEYEDIPDVSPAGEAGGKYIKLLVTENPKQPGSKARIRFDKYKNGMTREEALEAGLTGADLRWDAEHGFITWVDKKPRLSSAGLGLDLVVEENRLRLYDSQTGERLRTHAEAETARREAEAAQQEAEAETARLREELARRRERKD